MYSDKTRFLIVTASIGSGHTRAAEAISSEIKRKYPQAEIKVVDFMSAKTAYLNGFIKEAYLKILHIVPDMYEFMYSFTSGRMPGFSVQNLLAMAMKNDMAALIADSRADVVVFTHPFPCAAAAYLKRTKQIDALVCGVITDFAVHQLWVYKEVDMYFVAHSSFRQQLASKGIEEWRIHDTGIPIAESFSRNYDSDELMNRLCLTNDRPVVLIMGGGLGLGGVKDALVELENSSLDMQIMVVAGENQELWNQLNKLSERSHHDIRVWGFSNNVPELMAVADVLVTKPGALTISEALSMHLPLILSEPIPGQEKENAAFIEKTGAAVWVKDMRRISEFTDRLLQDQSRLTFMRQQAAKVCRPYAAKQIVEHIIDGLPRPVKKETAG